jgi:hypothetical protein
MNVMAITKRRFVALIEPARGVARSDREKRIFVTAINSAWPRRP